MKSKIEIELKKSIITGKCLHKVISETGGTSLCENKKCEGYSAYDNGKDVHFCEYYTRLRKCVFDRERRK